MRWRLLVLLFILVWMPMLVRRASAKTIVLPPETGGYRGAAELADAYCLACHSSDYVETQPPKMPRDFWRGIIAKMQKVYGAPIGDDSIEPLTDYFTKAYGSERKAP